MATSVPRNAVYVCRACRSSQTSLLSLLPHQSRQSTPRAKHQGFLEQRRTVSSKIPPPKTSRVPSARPSRVPPPQPQVAPKTTQPGSSHDVQHAPSTTSEVPINAEDVRGTLRDIQLQINAICASTNLSEELKLLEIMDKAYQFANVLVFGQTTAPDEEAASAENEEDFADKDLLSELDEPPQTSRKPESSAPSVNMLPISYRERSAQTLSETLYTLLKDPKVLISEPVLSIYVRIICQLGSPEYLPEIFYLYASKPQPVPNSSPIQYRNPSPNSSKHAVPQELSDVALDTAILQRDLSLAVAIIDTTVSTRAFRVNKFIRKASLPLALVSSTPVAAYAAADWVSNWQNSLDPQMAKAVTLMATAAYLGTLTTVGFVAITTYNDHHERVRWTEGTPLRYRWVREEERLYFDRIAMAWGFQRKRRRGEEMGGLWEELREECGARGMVLDQSNLLPGMQ